MVGLSLRKKNKLKWLSGSWYQDGDERHRCLRRADFRQLQGVGTFQNDVPSGLPSSVLLRDTLFPVFVYVSEGLSKQKWLFKSKAQTGSTRTRKKPSLSDFIPWFFLKTNMVVLASLSSWPKVMGDTPTSVFPGSCWNRKWDMNKLLGGKSLGDMVVRAGQNINKCVAFQKWVYKLLILKPDSFSSSVSFCARMHFFSDNKYLLSAYHRRNWDNWKE